MDKRLPTYDPVKYETMTDSYQKYIYPIYNILQDINMHPF